MELEVVVSILIGKCLSCRENEYKLHNNCGHYAIDKTTNICLYCSNPLSNTYKPELSPIKITINKQAINNHTCAICKRMCDKNDTTCWHCGFSPHLKAEKPLLW